MGNKTLTRVTANYNKSREKKVLSVDVRVFILLQLLQLLLWSVFSTFSTKHFKIILSQRATISRGSRIREVLQNYRILTGKRMVTFYGCWSHKHNKLQRVVSGHGCVYECSDSNIFYYLTCSCVVIQQNNQLHPTFPLICLISV